ncbi:MAG: TrkH family potassium uptake protein [Thermoplasmatota archaeon]
MRLKELAAGVGTLLFVIPVSLVLPLIVGLLYKENMILIISAYGLPSLLALSLGALLTRWGGKIGSDFRPTEALSTVSFFWILVAVFGALPYMIMGTIPDFVSAFFESMSGFTTTGSSVLTEIDGLPNSILLWRAETQWIGGVGIIVMVVALLSTVLGGHKAGFLMMKGEVPGHSHERVVPRLKDSAKVVITVYLILTAAEIFLLTLLGLSFYEAVCHTFTTLSTGGFGTHTASIGHYSNYDLAPLIEGVFIAFMIFGCVNFILHNKFLRGNIKAYLMDFEFRVFIAMWLVFVGVVAVDLWVNDVYALDASIRHSFFNVTSIISTTGYATQDFDAWPDLSRYLLLMMMLMGGMTGSTSGAIKTARLLIASKALTRSIRRIGHPRAHIPIKVGDVIFSEDIVRGVGMFIFAYLAIFVFASFVMTLTGLDPLSAISSVATTMGGVGPGLNMIGPNLNFSEVTDTGKVILSMLMWIGRLEIITCFVLFFPSTWKS